MPDQLNRSPCPRPRKESAQAPRTGALREERPADRAPVTVREETRGGKTVVLLDVTVATAGRVNRNGRLYSREVWQGAVAAAQDDLTPGRLWGLLEHPEDGWDTWDPAKGRMERICVRYESLAMDGDVVKATGVVLDTATGRDLRALVEGGIAVGISSNGTGTAKYLKAKEVPGLEAHPDPEAYIEIIQDDYRLLTIDVVSDPSDTSGVARQKEQRRKENTMKWNQKVKKTAERLGLSVEAFAEQHADWANELQNEVDPTPTPAPAAQEGTVSPEAYRTLEQTVVALRGQVETLTTANHNATRDGIAITALEAARLPSSGKIGAGDSEIDLDASFRAELIQVARAAESADAALAAVNTKITERRAVIGQREGAPAPRGSGSINLPTGNNSRQQTEADRNRSGDGTRRIESIRSTAGLI